MRLLFDQNLSFRLCRLLADIFPGSVDARRVGLADADDEAVWRFARANGFVLVTQDADFSELALLRGAPPKVIWLRCGNRPTEYVGGLLRRHAEAITDFSTDTGAVCLEIYPPS